MISGILRDLEDIYYFEAVDNKVFLYLEKEVYETKLKLYELEDIFQGRGKGGSSRRRS